MDPFRYRIAVEWSDEDKAFIARVPALSGCIAHGPTAEKATHEVRVAADAMLSVLKEDGDPPPPDDTTADFSGQLRIRLPRSLHESLARSAQLEGVSLNQLMVARLAGVGRSAPIDREAKFTRKAEKMAAKSSGPRGQPHDYSSKVATGAAKAAGIPRFPKPPQPTRRQVKKAPESSEEGPESREGIEKSSKAPEARRRRKKPDRSFGRWAKTGSH
jgi:predicted RNase H-like HicB family nuclease